MSIASKIEVISRKSVEFDYEDANQSYNYLPSVHKRLNCIQYYCSSKEILNACVKNELYNLLYELSYYIIKLKPDNIYEFCYNYVNELITKRKNMNYIDSNTITMVKEPSITKLESFCSLDELDCTQSIADNIENTHQITSEPPQSPRQYFQLMNFDINLNEIYDYRDKIVNYLKNASFYDEPLSNQSNYLNVLDRQTLEYLINSLNTEQLKYLLYYIYNRKVQFDSISSKLFENINCDELNSDECKSLYKEFKEAYKCQSLCKEFKEANIDCEDAYNEDDHLQVKHLLIKLKANFEEFYHL